MKLLKSLFKPTKVKSGERIKKDSEAKDSPNVSFFRLFKFSTYVDIIYIIVSIILASISGAVSIVMFIIFGNVTGELIDFQFKLETGLANDSMALKAAEDSLIEHVWYFFIYNSLFGCAIIILTYFGVLLISIASIKQISKLRSSYMISILNKDIAWYDTNQTGDFSSRIIEDIGKIEDAIGDKLSTFAYYIANCIAGTITGIVKGWELALICLIYLPASMMAMSIVSSLSKKLVKQEIEAYAKAATIAEEVLGAIRTVVAFGGQEKEIARYKDSLTTAKNNNIKRGLFTAINNLCMWFFVFASYALSFYYGVKLIIDERDLTEQERIYTPANMIIVFFNVMVASWNLGQCAPFFQTFAAAKAAATRIFAIIDEKPIINLSKNNGYKPKRLEGNIRFSNVHFQYPARPDVHILKGLSLDIHKGETVAIVGSSGCGKSTCIQLLQRFYDPQFGEVSIDGIDLKDFDLKWLRNRIGVVGQEPVLFATTIEENIRYGNKNATLDDIQRAAEKANAHKFINMLPQKYQTLVGERGTQLSGGQKQRIAIARALVRNPTILLLDEATSALDTHSEALVQAALDKASRECTTIIVAHRLSTICRADRILVIHEGAIVEDGNHDSLMQQQGFYFNLVTAQVMVQYDDTSATDNIDERESSGSPCERKSIEDSSWNDKEINPSIEKKMGGMQIIWEILKINRPEWFLIIVGCIGAFVQGAAMPIYSVIYGDVIGVLSNGDNEFVRQEGNKFSLYFLIIGVGCGIGALVQTYLFVVSGEKLTLRIRTKMFKALVKQEMGWFDQPAHGIGALCTTLSLDASGIQGTAGQPIGTVINSVASLGISIALSFYFEWRLSLVALCFVPLIFVTIYMEVIMVNATTSGRKDCVENSAKYAIEGISNIRTVASLGIERTFHTKYLELLGPHYMKAKRSGHLRGVMLGLARSMMYFCYGVIIYYGGLLIRDQHLHYEVVIKVFQAMISGAWAAGMAVAFTPNFQKGLEAAEKFCRLMKRIPLIQDGHESMAAFMENTNVQFHNVTFAYPTRPGVDILKGLDLKLLNGKTIALVGPSGCGKTTIIHLLERFYDPHAGFLTIYGRNTKFMKLSTLRSQLGIVSQEPNLFDRTIMENIAYGDNKREITPEEVINAAKKANIHNFITSLPLGYETIVGDKGIQLSGGQKQRVAIARALIRDPQILLLDEATSALDTESEKVVQAALDQAKCGRTCITIAHRLITIQDADVICVLDKGSVAEMGTHGELLEKRGIYHKLYNMQLGGK